MFRSPARLALLAAAALVSVACSQTVDDVVETSAHSIVGGEEAEPGAWPGTVALYKGGTRPSCGGALVADQWVVTAGHCVSTYSATGGVTKVVIGRHRLSTDEGETRTVDAVYRHPRYANLDNDIALLHLSEPTSAPKAKLIRADQVDAIVAGAMTTAVGWGNTREGGSPSDVLRQVDVPVISNEQCKTYPSYSRVTANMICAGYPQGQRDACQGDSGSPLFMNIDGENVVIGLVSWGIGCARANAPGVYTRVSNYLDWMAETSNNEISPATAPTNGGEPDAEGEGDGDGEGNGDGEPDAP